MALDAREAHLQDLSNPHWFVGLNGPERKRVYRIRAKHTRYPDCASAMALRDFLEKARRFERTANRPEAWEFISKELLAAAEILKDREMVRPVEMMLRGFALENLMKAWWVKQEHAIVRDGEYIGPRDHHLASLAEVFGLTDLAVDPKRTVLEQLSRFMTFVGRYPIPTHAGDGDGVGWNTPQDDETLDEIFQDLRAKLA